MRIPATSEPGPAAPLPHPKVRIDVRDFGPVAEGSVELRPLTVFVGPSNTGKTYFAILIYALHRVFGGFPRLPLPHGHGFPYGGFDLPTRRIHAFVQSDSESEESLSRKALRIVLDKLDTKGRAFMFSDLPKILREMVESNINSDVLGSELAAELQRCFDLESVSEMIRRPRSHGAKTSLQVNDENRILWQFGMDVSRQEIKVSSRIEDMVLLEGGEASNYSRRRFRRLESLVRVSSRKNNPYILGELMDLVIDSAGNRRGDTCYLPAVRGGIMQSHRVIASTLVGRSTRVGFERLPEIPTFSGGVADFMQRLILYDEDQADFDLMAEIADAMEAKTLSGRILTTRSAAGGYPEFVYRPRETEQDIRLTRASSMVSELAPVVLFLRGIVSPGDTLIIEEPEAHLHPAAQTQMAVTLARLVRAGVRVVVTTHSDWLLQAIANLIREGELGEYVGEPGSETSPPSWLRPQEVGIWLFRQGQSDAGSKVEEIPFDRSEGIEPRDYEDVAETLYNRSAELQNQLAEAAGGSWREQE